MAEASTPDSPKCSFCTEWSPLRDVWICPSCKRSVCDNCCYRFGGRPFCSKRCSEFYFFGDEDSLREE